MIFLLYHAGDLLGLVAFMVSQWPFKCSGSDWLGTVTGPWFCSCWHSSPESPLTSTHTEPPQPCIMYFERATPACMQVTISIPSLLFPSCFHCKEVHSPASNVRASWCSFEDIDLPLGFTWDLPAYHGLFNSVTGLQLLLAHCWCGSAGGALCYSRIATNSHQDQCTAKKQAIYLPSRQMTDDFAFDSLNRSTTRCICTI